jgi:NAD(P)-dependent dehydrogenase (short-subunit alcohol dehydrogenase family)
VEVARSLESYTTAIVGASSGIGRGMARRLIDGGAQVFVAARRIELLDALIAEAGAGVAVQCDLRDDGAGERVASTIALSADHLDALFISAGSAPLRKLVDTSEDEWRSALETNVIGINRLMAGVLPLLRPQSVVVVISSETAVLPRSHLGAYGASKAALEHTVSQWREEYPWLRLTVVSLGGTMPTEFGRQFEADLIVEALHAWSASGRNQEAFMDTEEVCDVLLDMTTTLLHSPSVGLHRLELRSPSAVANDLTFLRETRGLT